jgi:hypothetical protein
MPFSTKFSVELRTDPKRAENSAMYDWAVILNGIAYIPTHNKLQDNGVCRQPPLCAKDIL